MLKFTGLMLLVGAFGLIGILKSEELKSRIRLLEDVQTMILRMKSQMKYLREPLPILLDKLSKKADSKAFLLLNRCVPAMVEKNGDMGQIWAENTVLVYEKTSLTDKDIEIICQIGTYLGQTDFEGQQMQFQTTEERLQLQIDEARELYLKKGPLYCKIGFLGGTAAALVLL